MPFYCQNARRNTSTFGRPNSPDALHSRWMTCPGREKYPSPPERPPYTHRCRPATPPPRGTRPARGGGFSRRSPPRIRAHGATVQGAALAHCPSPQLRAHQPTTGGSRASDFPPPPRRSTECRAGCSAGARRLRMACTSTAEKSMVRCLPTITLMLPSRMYSGREYCLRDSGHARLPLTQPRKS